IRNHGGVPDINEDEFELEIGGLSRILQAEVTVTLQCSGT
ncbi:hypothetical protein MPER_13724, partial [Moniliophthora perniciosa FA553]